jgi:hypothetical protein
MRFLINGVISGFILVIFERIGWIAFPHPPNIFVDQTFNLLLIAFIVGFLVGVMMTIIGKVYGLFIIATCLIGIITLPFFLAAFGYLSLWIVSLIFPNWIAITTGVWWKSLLLSLALGLIRYHETSQKRGNQESGV